MINYFSLLGLSILFFSVYANTYRIPLWYMKVRNKRIAKKKKKDKRYYDEYNRAMTTGDWMLFTLSLVTVISTMYFLVWAML